LSFKDAANGDIEAQSDEFSVVTKGNANVTSSENGSTGRNSTSQYNTKNSAGQISVFSSAGACLFIWIIAFGWLWGVLFT
jgi:hypothetical protein